MKNQDSFCSKLAFSTLELIISITLSLPLVLIAYRTLRTDIYVYKKTQEHYEETYKILRIKSIFEEIKRDIDAHHFNLLPIIHPKGQILYPDLSANTMSFRSKQDSNAITYLKLNALKLIKLKHSELNSFEACNQEIVPFKSCLGIYLNGFQYYKSETIKAKNCSQIKLSSSKNMFVQNEPVPLENIKIILPIIDEYTIYQDFNNRLRYLGHLGDINIENQPIINDSPIMLIKQNFWYQKQLSELNLQLKFQNKYSDLNFRHLLARNTHYGFYLQHAN